MRCVPRGTLGKPLADSSDQIAHLLEAALHELGHRDRELGRRLATLVELVFAWSGRINLTGHRNREAIARELVLDALGLASLVPEQGDLIDLGSGAGFPGLPIALSRPRCRVTLIDSRQKRHHFQRTAIRELSIHNAEARFGRAELLAPTPHRTAVARAAGPIEEVVSWMLPWLEPGGLLLVPIHSAGRVPEIEGVVTLGLRSYAPPLAGRERWVWAGRKPASPSP